MTASLWNRLALAAILTAAVAAFLAIHHIRRPMLAGPFGHVLADPDSYQRWGLVRRALDGEGVRIRWINADNAPFGRMNEWTSPATILGVAATRTVEILTGLPRENALELAGQWLGPVIGIVHLLTLAWLGWRAGGLPLAAAWLVAWTPALQVLRVTQFGNTDHHALHQWAMLVMLAGLVAWREKPTVAGGVFIGAAGALGLWSGASEVLPAWLCVAALAVWESRSPNHPRDFWRAWWLSGATLTFAALLFEFWPHPFHRQLDFLSIWHVALWVIGGALAEYAHRRQPYLRESVLPVALAVLTALLVAGALRGFDWANMHSVQDERFIWQMTVTHEFTSYASLPLLEALDRVWWSYGLLPVLLALAAIQCRQLTVRGRWLLLTFALFALLGLYQQRWESFTTVAAIVAAGAVLQERFTTRRRWWTTGIMALAVAPCWWLLYFIEKEAKPLRANPALGPHGTTFGLDAVSRCLGREAPGAILLATWDQSGVLAGMGAVRTIGTGYWSNMDGLFESYELMTTTSTERFRELFEKRQIQYLLARAPGAFAGDIAWAFIALHGRVPTREEIEATVVWKIAAHPNATVVDCPELRRAAPDWRLVKLR